MKFVLLGHLTEQGIKNLKMAEQREKKANEILDKLGCKLLNMYYTMGRYDWVAIAEGPDIQTAMKALFMFGISGTDRTETLVAITVEEARKLIEEIP
ncbi:MAG: GYD domain-containing protein [Promethearchaeota archaeon]